jgi:hypothetical protein
VSTTSSLPAIQNQPPPGTRMTGWRGTGGDEDPTEADVAGLSGDTLAVEGEDDRDSEVDATRARDDLHLFAIVAGSRPGRSSAADGRTKNEIEDRHGWFGQNRAALFSPAHRFCPSRT